MQKFYILILSILSVSLCGTGFSQSVLDPTDPVITYDSNNPPAQPAYGQIGKWIRTVRLSWNTSSYKAYIYKGSAFRLKFPKTYNPNANDGKKYPMMVFFHGLGETGNIYDNEYQLYHGGDVFRDAVDNGKYDGYILCMQSQAYWDPGQYNYIAEIIDYMVANNKLDAFQVSDNGLSDGGQATWGMLIDHPTYISASLPMSASSITYESSTITDKIKFTPMWLFQGGLDGSPAPYTSKHVRDYILAAGGDFKYTEYPDLGHGVWDRVWQEPDFWPFLLRGYASNPWTLYGRTEFCPSDNINVTIGLPPGFDEYQWRKNNVPLSATTNTINVTDTASYTARVRRGSVWSDWSHTPAHIIIKAPTITPPITVSGLMSTAIPSADGKNYVNLEVPDNGYISYTWKKVGSPDILSTNRIYTAAQPGNYIVAVTELYGCSSNYSTPFTVINANGSNAPDPASSLTALTVSNTKIQLNWSNSPTPAYNETAFEIYRSTTAGASYSFIGQVPADTLNFIDKGLTPNVKYYYRIRAINFNGAAALSNEASATTESDKIAPTAPANLTVASSTNTSVNLTWDASTDNVGIDRYEVFVNGVKTNSTSQTSFVISGLKSLAQYTFYVKAKDISGNYSPQSNQVSAPTVLQGLQYSYYQGSWSILPDFNTLTPIKTGKTTNVDITVRNRDDQFGFVWQGFIRIPVAGTYKFETYSDDGSKLWLGKYDAAAPPLVNNDGLHAPTYASGTVTLQAGVYPISASFFEQGGGELMQLYWTSSELYGDNNRHQITDQYLNDTYTPNGSIPVAPTNFAATALDYTRIQLTWTDNSNNETGFEVYRAANTAGPFNIVATTNANVVSFTDSALAPATTYYYKVIAINQIGSSISGGLKYSYYEGSWDNLPDFNNLSPVKTGSVTNISLSPANNTTNYAFKYEGNITVPANGQYTFYTKSDDGSKLYIGGFDNTNLVVNNDYLQGATERSGTITLNQGIYPVYVTFFQKAGGYYLDASYQGPGINKQLIPDNAFTTQPASATTLNLPGAPLPATLVKAVAKSSSLISLTWIDNATNETGYSIYRSTGDASNFKLLASLPVNSITYKDSSLFAHITYYYKVTVTGAGGASANSLTVSATTKDNFPVINDIANRSVRYGITTTIQLTATDPDGDSLTYSIKNKPAFAKLVNNGDKTGTLTLTPKFAQLGTYSNIQVIVNDNNKGKDTTTFTLTVSSNYDPSIDNISNYTITENDSVNINLTGHDQNNDNLTWTVTNAPANSYITQNTGSTAVLHIRSNYASSGLYNIQVAVNDGNGGTAAKQFNLTVNDKNPNTTIYTRFMYDDPIGSPWNSITGKTTNNLKDTSNNPTGVNMTFQTSWWATFDNGPQTGNNSGVYPDPVLQDYYYFGIFGGPDSVAVKLSGLDQSLKYNLTFYAGSLFPGTPDNGNTTYTVDTTTVSLYVQNNTQNTVSINGIKPDATGSIIFKMGKASNAAVGYINALIINSVYDDGTAPLAPQLISAQAIAAGVKLTWQDVAYNETNYRVFRAASLNGTYILLDSTVNANVTSYIDSNVNGNTQYYYKLRASNNYGKSAFSNILGVYVGDRIPVLTPISNVVIKNNQQLTVNVTAQDDNSDHVTLKASQLPSFVTFTDNGDGTGVFSLQPTAGTTGYYGGVTVTATDNSDSSRSVSFDITVTDNLTTGIYLNFSDGSLIADKPWNNLSGYPVAGKVFTNITDQNNNATNINVTLVDGFQGVIASGMRPGNGKTIYPPAVVRTGEYEGTASARTVRITGLSTTKKYNFVFFNSHEDGLNGLTNFTINGQTVSLNASYNIDKTVEINNISPDINGQVNISVAKGAGADYAYLSAMVIQSYDASVTILPPSDLRVTDTKRTSVSLQWADRSYNENGFEIWRADDSNSTYALLTTVAPNTVIYKDSNLTANKSYYYVVRSINLITNSNFSNTAVAHTLAYAVYVNFTTLNLAHSPWNNTAAPPQIGNSFNNLYDEADHVTNIGVTDVNAFAGEYTAGMNTGNNSGIYPDSVLAESYGVFPGQTGILKITGLNLNMKYNFTFFASSQAYGDVNVAYTVNGKTVLLNASLNTKGAVTMYDIVPDVNGEVNISIAPGTPASQFGLIGALVVQGFDASSPSVPTAPALQNTPVASIEPAENLQKQSLQQNISDIQIKAYPNPFINSFNVSVTINQNEDVNVQMYNMAGKIVYANKFNNLFKGQNTFTIQPNVAASGAYIVKLIFSNEKLVKVVKILKQ